MNKPPPRLRLRVTAAAESIVRSRHPWLFADSIREQNREGETGELAVIYDRQDKFLAVGLFDPDSPIRVRILHAGKPATIDDAWWRERLGSTMARRAGLLDATTNAGRLIHGESDGWPGLVLDRYDTTVVLKLYSAAWLPRLDEVLGWIRHELSPGQLVLRLSRNIQDVARSRFQRVEGWLAAGTTDDKSVAVSNPVVFQETGLRFEADVIQANSLLSRF
jgi:23S rRNA (cytosine1962-C5)-methyltransferase